MNNYIIHCNPSELDNIKAQGLEYRESPIVGDSEIDVIIPATDSLEELTEDLELNEEFVNLFNLNYNNVNWIEQELENIEL